MHQHKESGRVHSRSRTSSGILVTVSRAKGDQMGRRDGTVDPRVWVSVSDSMAKLRRTQGVLNGFWQTSELAYGYLLLSPAILAEAPARPTVDVLGHVESAVWFPNNQGRIKRRNTIGTTLTQVRDNTVHTYRATLFSFFAAFEAYLEERVAHLKPAGMRWGEYVRSLSQPALIRGAWSVPLPTLLCADLCREVRNKMIHEDFWVPSSLNDPRVLEWKSRLQTRANAAGWTTSEVGAAVNFATHQVIGQAVAHVQNAKREGKTLPLELFYMLFSFTNLDSLAFALEEVLQPLGSGPANQISRKQSAVRRTDLIIGSAD